MVDVNRAHKPLTNEGVRVHRVEYSSRPVEPGWTHTALCGVEWTVQETDPEVLKTIPDCQGCREMEAAIAIDIITYYRDKLHNITDQFKENGIV